MISKILVLKPSNANLTKCSKTQSILRKADEFFECV